MMNYGMGSAQQSAGLNASQLSPQLSTVQSSPMDAVVAQLHQRTESLYSLVSKLGAVLEPVRFVGPVATSNEKAVPQQPMCALEAAVDSANSKLANIGAILENILSSLRV